jgi:phosphate transport system substrate-binding protein
VRLTKSFLCLLLGLLVITAGKGALAEPDQLVIGGSTTIYPLSLRIARQFMRDHRHARVTVDSGGSGEGLRALLAGEVDIANSSRFISAEELSTAMGAGIYPVPFRIADDCIIPIVHKRNKLKELSRDQLRQIYIGEIKNWREVGGEDLEVRVISRDVSSGTYGVWRDLVMAGETAGEHVSRVASSAEMVLEVSGQRGAIGYISLGHLSANIKPLRVEGVMGSLYTVRDGSYVLSRPLFMFTRGWPRGSVLEFINYALDPDRGQVTVRKSGFTPVHLRINGNTR